MSHELGPAGLPDADPDAPHVAWRMVECRTCHEHSDWAPDESETPDDWQLNHAEESQRKHTHFYVWRIARNLSRQGWLPF